MPLLGNKILASGELASLALISKKHNLPAERKRWKKDIKLAGKIGKHVGKMRIPVDAAILVKGRRKEFFIDEIPKDSPIYDLGSNTIKIYEKEISNSKTILFKGPPGKFENRNFEKGTKLLLKAIQKSKAFSVIAGGQSSDAIEKFHISKKGFSYISLSGGALVEFLAGKKLPGLVALGLE